MRSVTVLTLLLVVAGVAQAGGQNPAYDSSVTLFSAQNLGATGSATSSSSYKVGRDEEVLVSVSIFGWTDGTTLTVRPLWTSWGGNPAGYALPVHGDSQTITRNRNGTNSEKEFTHGVDVPKGADTLQIHLSTDGTDVRVSGKAAGY